MAIYDCSLFYNEIEMLEYRLMVLYKHIDFFIIVELGKTHRGENREFIFEKEKERYKKYLDKIIYIKIKDNIPTIKNREIINWSIENFHRNCILIGLKKLNLNFDDIIIISDADEIINPDILNNLNSKCVKLFGDVHIFHKLRGICYLLSRETRGFKDLVIKKYTFNELLDKMPLSCEQNLYYFFVNNMANKKWKGSVIVKYKNMQSPQNLRNLRNALPCIKNGGWHFSYMGGVDRIELKYRSTVETVKANFKRAEIEAWCNKGVIKNFWGKKLTNLICLEDLDIKNIKELINKYPYLYKDI